MTEITLSEFRPKLTAALELVKNGQKVAIMQRGKVIALLVPPPAEVVIPPEVKNQKTDLQRAKDAQKARDDILRGVNKKS